MDKVLREIFRKNPYFEEINENRYVPEFLGLIVNGVVVYHVNWIDIVENEIIFMHKDIQTHPIVSLVLDNPELTYDHNIRRDKKSIMKSVCA